MPTSTAYDLSTGSCACCGPACPGCLIPTTLYATVTVSCAGYSAAVVAMAYKGYLNLGSGFRHVWSGPLPSTCGTTGTRCLYAGLVADCSGSGQMLGVANLFQGDPAAGSIACLSGQNLTFGCEPVNTTWTVRGNNTGAGSGQCCAGSSSASNVGTIAVTE